MIARTDPLTAARAEALFVSDLSATGQPTAVLVEAAVKRALQTRGGARGCAADLAAASFQHLVKICSWRWAPKRGVPPRRKSEVWMRSRPATTCSSWCLPDP